MPALYFFYTRHTKRMTRLKTFFIFSGATRFWGYGAVWAAFVLLSLWIAPYHEMWADEAQALLIAQNASFYDIISEIPHNEMHPSLWYLLLKLSGYIFGTHLNIAYISVFIMSAAVGVLLFGCKIPTIYKILLPFGHYFLYQYNIISRNYCLAYLALALLGALYHKRHSCRWGYAGVLLLMAESTFILAPTAAVLGLFWLAEAYKFHRSLLWRYIAPFGMLAIAGIFFFFQIFPFNHAAFADRVARIGCSPSALPSHFAETFFFGENLWLNLAFILFIAYFAIKKALQPSFYEKIWQNKDVAAQFITVWGIFCLTYGSICPMYYHQGLIWGVFLCSIYMFFPRYVCNQKHYLFLACAAMHIFWSFKTIAYNMHHAYSAQFETAALVAKHSLPNAKVATAGYHTLPLRLLIGRGQLYFLPGEKPYHIWLSPEEAAQKNIVQNTINQHLDIFAIDVTETGKADLSYYQNPKEFYEYHIPAAATYKGYLFFEQSLLLYIKKRLIHTAE